MTPHYYQNPYENPNDTGQVEGLISGIFSAGAAIGAAIITSDVQKSLGEKTIKLQQTIADRQFSLEKQINDAQLGLLGVQKTGLVKMQDINIEIANSQKNLILTENDIKISDLKAQQELSEAARNIAGVSATPPAQTKILGLSKRNFFITSGILAAGGAWFLLRSK